MFCRKCGEQLPDEASFCSNCGEACVKPILPVQEAAPELDPIPVMIVPEVAAPEVIEEVPVEEIPEVIEEVPVEEIPEVIEETPVEEIPEVIEEAPVEEIPEVIEETPVEEIPQAIEEAPVEEAPAEVVAEEVPVQQIPAEPVHVAEPVQPAPKKAKKIKKRPCFGVRFLMQFLSLILCLVLIVTLVVGVVVMDARRLTSGDGLKVIIDGVMFGGKHSSAAVEQLPPAAPQIQDGYGVVSLGNTTLYMEEVIVDTDAIGSMESMDELIDWLYDELTKSVDDVDFSKSQFKDFVEESTVGEYLSDKMAGFAEDVLHGTANTQITTDEVMDLLEENERLLKKDLGVELTAKDKQELRKNLKEEIEDKELVKTLRDSVSEELNSALQESAGMDLESMQSFVRDLNSDGVLLVMLGAILLLMGLLLLTNFYNLGAGLTWSASAGLFVGLIVSLPLMLLDPIMDAMLSGGNDAVVSTIVPAVAKAFSPIHYGLLGISFMLLAGSIVIRCISRKRRRMQLAAA